MSVAEGVEFLVSDGDTVALEGFVDLLPMAAGHEIIRQGKRDLTLVRMSIDLVYDQLIGAGCASTLVFAWGGNPGLGTLHRFRDAVENDWPGALEIEEHSDAGMVNRYSAGASGSPFAILRSYLGTDLPSQSTSAKFMTCPFTGVEVVALPALNPDVTVLHAQRADRAGNVQFWGVRGAQREAALAARRTLVTVEEVVDRLERMPGDVVLPSWAVDVVAVSAGGAAPSHVPGYYERDGGAYTEWGRLSRDRAAFGAWLTELKAGR
ncbi:3-oxoadipate--succinyl-CoA transferase subunit A [Amycolatopsis antarctica]|uniref:3-oxoadipate--succinyl-CoA transferase subunit A n=1 Tax=Amycolatopsis antarctica TaxID=1854586 RepID=A0A263D3N0_9PSEU|nr:3-oxoadipate--succinyl-CoA transferase subunit A [Amycolatopsis antarctica]